MSNTTQTVKCAISDQAAALDYAKQLVRDGFSVEVTPKWETLNWWWNITASKEIVNQEAMTPLTDEQVDEIKIKTLYASLPNWACEIIDRRFAGVRRLQAELANVRTAFTEEIKAADLCEKDLRAELTKARAEAERLRAALLAIEQRSNEHGTGMTWCIDTVHALYGIARAALAPEAKP